MYSTCLFCSMSLGANHNVPSFPVGRRLAFDAAAGRLWVVCTKCGRWNLTPLDERWEAIDECERLFRGTRLRMSTDNVGLARLISGLELVRIGPALLPEIASWRYGTRLSREGAPRRAGGALARGGHLIARGTASALVGYASSVGLSDQAMLRMRTFRHGDHVLARGVDDEGAAVVIRYAHLGEAELIRPDKRQPWRLRVRHDGGVSTLAEGNGLRTAGKLLATLNFGIASPAEVAHAIVKLDAAGDPDGYFTRVASLAMRTSWGRFPEARDEEPLIAERTTFAERLALQLANRSFWAHGGTGSQEHTPLFRLPAVDRLALEMAANEDVERRAMQGELDALRAAWKEAEEIAAIADGMFADDVLSEFKRQYAARLERDRELA